MLSKKTAVVHLFINQLTSFHSSDCFMSNFTHCITGNIAVVNLRRMNGLSFNWMASSYQIAGSVCSGVAMLGHAGARALATGGRAPLVQRS